MPRPHPSFFTFWATLGTALLLALSSARAHHGLDFLLVQDAFVPAPGKGVIYGGFDWTEINGTNFYGSEPGFMLGLLPGLAFGLSSNLSDAGDDWQFYSLSPYVQFQLLPQAWSRRVRLAARFGYEFSLNPYLYSTVVPVTRIETLQSTQTFTAPRPRPAAPAKGSGGGTGPVLPKHGGHGHSPPAAAPRATTQVRTTTTTREITTYEERQFEQRVEGWHARLMMEADLSERDRIVFNLVHFSQRSEKPLWGYAAGLRHAFHHDFAVSAEALGNFTQENWHQAVLSLNYAPVHWGLVKLGAAFGLTRDTPDLTLITGFVLRF